MKRFRVKQECLGKLSDLTLVQDALKFPSPFFDTLHICSFNEQLVVARSDIKSAIEADLFVEAFTESSGVTWRITRTNPQVMSAGQKNIFWKTYHCQCSNIKVPGGEKGHRKHTNCMAAMTITVKNVPRYCRSKDPHISQYPTVIKVRYNHNHDLLSDEALSLRDVRKEVKEEFIALFKSGHTPTTAFETYKTQLMTAHGDDYYKIEFDRSKCPDLQWCYRLYKVFKAQMENSLKSDDILNMLKDKSEELKASYGIDIIKTFEEQEQLVLVVGQPRSAKTKSKRKRHSDSSSEESSSSSEYIQSVTKYDPESVDFFAATIKAKLKENPKEYGPAVSEFMCSFKNLCTDTELVSALNSFGKVSGELAEKY